MRHLLPALLTAVSALLLTSCGSGGSSTPATAPLPADPQPAAAPASVPLPETFDVSTLPQSVDSAGMAQGVLGVYYLHRDPADPSIARLEMPRSAQAKTQGDLFALSIRPFMSALDLVILGTTAGPNNTTDYVFRFTHPFDMPTNLDPPQSASKRVDLFIFDTTLLVAADGDGQQGFFGGTVWANLDAVPNADGYRGVGPLFDTAAFGIANANTFPYKLIHNINDLNPAGNYDAVDGWVGNEYLNPSGYDVIPQGAEAQVNVRISNAVPNDPLPLVVLAKYMDPRNGNSAYDKRQNRLPSADPTGLRYFLPEACGDMQVISANVTGELLDTNKTDVVTVRATVQDWDATATTSLAFPDHSNITHIAERSGVQDAQVSVPALKANGVFNGLGITPIAADVPRFLEMRFDVNNADMTYKAPAGGALLPGLIRLRDQQDFTQPTQLLLDENLVPQTGPAGFQPSSRYQKIEVPIQRGLRPPEIVSIEPLEGMEGDQVQLQVITDGDAVTDWEWALTFSFDPPVSTDESPTVTLISYGTQRCAVTVSNAAGSDSEFFTFTIHPPPPVLESVTPFEFWQTEEATFSAVNTGGPASSWDWDFVAATAPGTSVEATPTVTGLNPGTFEGTVTASNISGNSAIPFTFTIIPATAPVVTEVLPGWVYGRRPVTFAVTTDPGTGRVEEWAWDFGGGCTPNESTEATPQVTSGMPGTYTGRVTVSNRYGSTDFSFDYEIRYREAGMNVYVIKNGATFPTLWWNLPSWSEEDVAEWFDLYVNSVFEPAAVRIPPDDIRVIYIEDKPHLYNLDNASENNELFNMLYFQGDYSRLNYYCINRNNYSGWAGVMSDRFCDYTNNNRGCIGVSYTTVFAQKIAAHELGHVFNLPHTRTNTSPITDLNRNLMGYGTNDVSLKENVFVETPGSCMIWPGNPHSQYQVVNDWFNQYSLLP